MGQDLREPLRLDSRATRLAVLRVVVDLAQMAVLSDLRLGSGPGLAQVERGARATLAAARRQDDAATRTAAAGLPDAFARSRAALLAWLPAA